MKHCFRSNGTERAWFNSPQEAAAFRETHPDYAEDVMVFCPKCGGLFHLSHPSWLVSRPWEIPVERLEGELMRRREDDLKICPSCGAIVCVLIRDLIFNALHCHNCLAATIQQAKQTAKPN